MAGVDAWDPGQYNRFADEREQPFWDLAGLLESSTSPRVVDLGCGDGRLTAALSSFVGARPMLGVDNSHTMISDAEQHRNATTHFEFGDISEFSSPTPIDIMFSNAALHWIADHETTLTTWRSSLAPGGQMAVQVPCNFDHEVHRLATEIASSYLDSPPPDAAAANVLEPQEYAEILDRLGFVRQSVRLAVYVHHLKTPEEVVEWIKGSTLTRFKGPMGEDVFDRYIDDVRRQVVTQLGHRSPYLYTFKRILMWGRLDGVK